MIKVMQDQLDRDLANEWSLDPNWPSCKGYLVLKTNNSITKKYFVNTNNVSYFKNGYLHRLDGPADIYYDDNGIIRSIWYYHGTMINCFSQKEFERYLKLKSFW